MMLIPIGDDNESHRPPLVTWLIITACTVLYFWADRQFVLAHSFYLAHPTPLDALTSTFLHGGLVHLFGNMLFFWIVADNVEDKFGHLGFLLFYLSAGVLASYADVITGTGLKTWHGHPIPELGASGAIAATMGAYVVLFPRAKIKMWGCFFYIFTFTIFVPTILAIGAWFVFQALDHIEATRSGAFTGVGYSAHISGFLFGAIVSTTLVFTGRIRTNWRSSAPDVDHSPVVVSAYPLEQDGPGRCPACLTKLVGEQCGICGGLWLPPERLDELRESPLPDALLHPPGLRPAASSRRPAGTRRCPVCQKPLRPDHHDGVDVEGCARHGLWLDRGQLLRLPPR